MYVYKKSEPKLYTVGFYKPDGLWESESDHLTQEEAAKRVHYLNGGNEIKAIQAFALRTVDFGANEQTVSDVVGRGQTVRHRGWTLYSTREAAEEMRRWVQLENTEPVEVVEVQLVGL